MVTPLREFSNMPLKIHQIESWALDIIERVNSGQPIEDVRVELKSEWITPEKAARRIAGHANAARGEPILWLIGVDEKSGVVGIDTIDLADWWPRVEAQFDGITPELDDINISVEDKTIVALYFETDRIPYVVKNPVYGEKGGGPVSLEVPWRKGTSTRSAKHGDLIQLLSTRSKLPDIEILDGSLTSSRYSNADGEHMNLSLEFDLYFVPLETGRIVIPIHNCSVKIEISNWLKTTKFDILYLETPSQVNPQDIFESRSASRTIEATRHELIIYGPGKVYLKANLHFSHKKDAPKNDAKISVRLLTTNSNIPASFNDTLKFTQQEGDNFRWEH